MAELTHLGKYLVEAELSRDPAATRYRALDTTLGREVVLWVVDPAVTADPARAGRIVRQARALARLQHPHLVAVRDVGEEEGRIFIATTPVQGHSLAVELARLGRLPWVEALAILAPVADALDTLHQQGVVHGDLKPENVVLDPERGAMLAGLEVARLTGGPRAVEPAYAAPEVQAGAEPSPASDLYALGRIAQEMLGETSAEVNAVVQWALAQEPGARPLSADAFIAALRRCATAPAEGAAPAAEAIAPILEAERPSYTTQMLRDKEAKQNRNFRTCAGCFAVVAAAIMILIGVVQFQSWQQERRWERTRAFLAPTWTAEARATRTAAPQATQTAVARATQTAEQLKLSEAALAARPVFIPAGEFLMGAAAGDAEATDAEKPQHTLYLDAYRIDRVEVTNAMYAACVQAGACSDRHNSRSYSRDNYYDNPEYANYPVILVSWDEARAYCRWAGGRLPTEAEWEKAVRGTDGRKYPWGNEAPDCNRLNYTGENGRCVGDTTAVGAYPSGASPYGLLDMAGNVSEWVADWYDENYYASSSAKNPTGPASGQEHVMRGGSWGVTQADVRAAHRSGGPPEMAMEILGFRCARNP